MSTGGLASERTLRDELAIGIASGLASYVGVQFSASQAWDVVERMLAEKARREATGKDYLQVQAREVDDDYWAKFQDGIVISFEPGRGGWCASIKEGPIGSGNTIAEAIASLRACWENWNVVKKPATDHSGDVSKMAVECGKIEFIPNATKQPDARALLRRFIDAVPDGFETSLLWDLRQEAISLLDKVPDHSPDAGKMAELEAVNRELVEALKVVVRWIASLYDVPSVANARAILAKHKGAA